VRGRRRPLLTSASFARYARVEKGGTMKLTQAMVGIAVLASGASSGCRQGGFRGHLDGRGRHPRGHHT
jgi:hypothetical protein